MTIPWHFGNRNVLPIRCHFGHQKFAVQADIISDTKRCLLDDQVGYPGLFLDAIRMPFSHHIATWVGAQMDFVTEAMLCKVFWPGDGKPHRRQSTSVGTCTCLESLPRLLILRISTFALIVPYLPIECVGSPAWRIEGFLFAGSIHTLFLAWPHGKKTLTKKAREFHMLIESERTVL